MARATKRGDQQPMSASANVMRINGWRTLATTAHRVFLQHSVKHLLKLAILLSLPVTDGPQSAAALQWDGAFHALALTFVS